MARAGIYKSEVVRARDKLRAMGRYPSIDAVRQELGNTGSKATIHRYLKEIEEEEGGKAGTQVAISEALHDLVARLAERLHDEAESRITDLTQRHAAALQQAQDELAVAQQEAAELRQALENAGEQLADEQARQRKTAERLQEEGLAHALASQQVTDLKDRLLGEEEHRRSLEEKHTQARQALEHFRAAAKEQREQEQRQHEQQVQYLQGEIKTLGQTLGQKQHELAQYSQDNARLVNELSRAEKSLHDAKTELRTLKGANEELASMRLQVERLGRRVVELEAQTLALANSNADLESGRAQDQTTIRQLQLDLATARTAADVQEQLAERIQVWMTQKVAGITPGPEMKTPVVEPKNC